MAEFREHFYQSADGLELFARDYAPDSPRGTILCMHGLTRNSADFEGIANHLAANYRLVVVDQRGRGRSDWDREVANYQPAVYVQDMFRLLDGLGIDRAIYMGTSMGGLMAMIMSAMQPRRVQAVIMNDIGPVINPAGLERIKGYVGKSGPVANWDQAVAQTREINGKEFPDFDGSDWLRFTRALYREDDAGVPVLAYDPAIARPMAEAQDEAVPPDLWPAFASLEQTPVLLVRGALSDILAVECVAEMRRCKPDLQVAEIPNRGHAPTLDEPHCISAIDSFLDSLQIAGS